MSCQPCKSRDHLPKCAIHAILNRLVCSLSSTYRHKNRKYEDFRCAVRILSSRSVDPRAGYAAFLGLRDNDPSKFAAIYIDNIRGEYDPNLGQHRVYHIAFVTYGDINAICRTLQQRQLTIAGNAVEQTGESLVEGSVALRLPTAQVNPNFPVGLTNPLPLGALSSAPLVPGTPEAIAFGNENAIF